VREHFENKIILEGEKRKMKVYISGPITNNPDYKREFAVYEHQIKLMGYYPVNPAAHFVEGYTWADYIKRDIKWLLDCDYIVKIPGWDKSKGARLESRIAESVGIKELIIKVVG
jgi:hypothetical protein